MAFETIGRSPRELRDHANPSPREARVLNLDVGLDEDIGSVKATIDTNGAVGSNTARYRIDGGSFTTVNIASDHTASFDVALIDDTQLLEIQAQNAQGEWGSLTATVLPIGNGRPSLLVTNGQAPSNQWSISYESVGILEYSVDGSAWTTPPSSPFLVAQSASTTRTVQFRCTRNGQTVSYGLFIPAIPDTAPATSVSAIAVFVSNESTDEFSITYTIVGPKDHVDVGWLSPQDGGDTFQSLGNVASGVTFTNSVLAPNSAGLASRTIRARIFVYDAGGGLLASATSAVCEFQGDLAS